MEVQADTAGPRTLAEYTELHQIVEKMPGDVMPTFELCYYNGLTQEAAAEILGVDKRTIQRRMRAAKQWLAERLRGDDGPS
jgi:RNA polymerase sigma-70 factor (ECF subfamily)